MKVKLSALELVYPPLSNQEAHWIEKDPATVSQLQRSDFYMIAARAEARFADLKVDQEKLDVHFNFLIGDDFSDSVTIKSRELTAIKELEGADYWIEFNEKVIRFWDGPEEKSDKELLVWFSTEKLIWDRSRGEPGIEGFEKYRDAATYDMLYVGIGKVNDSFTRLIKKGHKARMDILANEPQRYPGARPTDEIFLFFFRVSSLFITTYDVNHEFTDKDFGATQDAKRIVADAEKAFVSLLKPKYNVVRFNNYPKGADGLYDSGYARYGYKIGENLSFNTSHGVIKGARDIKTGILANGGHMIFVEGDKTEILKSRD